MSGGADGAPSRRLDRWLWCARRFRTRTLAANFISEAGVRVTRRGVTERIDKPGYQLTLGDTVSYMIGERVIALAVTGFADRRGPPAAARDLYAQDAASPCNAAG